MASISQCPVCGRSGVETAERCPQCKSDLQALRLVGSLPDSLPPPGEANLASSNEITRAALVSFVISLLVVGLYHLVNTRSQPLEPGPVTESSALARSLSELS